jgi:hypothetical protein
VAPMPYHTTIERSIYDYIILSVDLRMKCPSKVVESIGHDKRGGDTPARQMYNLLDVSVSEETNRETEAEPQQIVAQGYSHAYSTPFLS